MRKDAEPRPSHSCGCSAAVRTGFLQSSCMAIPRPEAAAMQRSSWKATADIWKRMAIRAITISQGSDAVPKGKQYDYSQPAVQGVQYCNRLFAIEDSINKKYPGDHKKRKQLRLEKEKPVLEAFWSWLDQQKPVRNTRMDKAVNYVINRRDTAQTYLEDGRCSFTNNLSLYAGYFYLHLLPDIA